VDCRIFDVPRSSSDGWWMRSMQLIATASRREAVRVTVLGLDKRVLGRTLVVVTHRLSTPRNAIGIVVQRADRITAEGADDLVLDMRVTFRTLAVVEQESSLTAAEQPSAHRN
jgi:hypothetical protein